MGSVYKISPIRKSKDARRIANENSIYEGIKKLDSQNDTTFSYEKSMALALS